jgi:hypothetical protein
MKTLLIASIVLAALPAGSIADGPKVNRAMIEAMENSLDAKLKGIWPPDPAEVVGVPQGTYIHGYGAVFLGEVNLAPAAGVSPFHPTISADEVTRTHDKKAERMATLRTTMRTMLMDSARSLDAVPGDEQVAVAISLFYWNWEKREGLPAQIVMHAPRKALLGAANPEQASIASEEY